MNLTANSPPSGAPGASACCVVGLGASAGGLESLARFFRALPDEPNLAFVVVQHLSPDYKTMMDELLARHTPMPIKLAENGMAIAPNTVYLLPPRKVMIVAQRRLLLTDKTPQREPSLPIDHFFRALAQDLGPKAAAVVLSGTGSDGSRGVEEVKRAGGIVLCESEATAKFNGMPLSAQRTGAVDHILAPEEMPGVLMDWVEGLATGSALEGDDPSPLHGVEAVFDLLRTDYNIDFSHYKPTTVARRIERRLALGGFDQLDDYIDRLRHDPEERRALYADLLIGVTRFFRDRACFDRLTQEVLQPLVQGALADTLRIWVAGCATGEEAYSIAMLLHEQCQAAGKIPNIKIFATDVHQASLEFASQGLYDEERLLEVSNARLSRYFRRQAEGFRVVPELRQMVVFAPHNVIKDAPFTRLDLVTCRNLLIYFRPKAQKKALSLFHFALKTGGYLFLGASETVGELAEEFERLSDPCRLYRKRRDQPMATDLPMTSGLNPALLAGVSTARGAEQQLIETYDLLLERFMPMGLLVDHRRQLLDSYAGAEKLLQPKGRRPSSDVLELLDPPLRVAVAGGLRRAQKDRQPVRFTGLRGSDGTSYRLTVEPLLGPKLVEPRFLIAFEPLALPSAKEVSTDPEALAVDTAVELPLETTERLLTLEQELNYTRENLQATIEELETSNEELQATNEELIAANEELQSTNEELNSVNEELYTINSEYQNKINELRELNEDMHHLLESTDIGTIFLDRQLQIRRFTPKVAPLFYLMPQDVGRSLINFSHRLDYRGLIDDIQRVLINNEPLEREVRDNDGKAYLLRLLPYHLQEALAGAVLTFIDITALDRARSQARQLSAIVEHSQDAIVGLDTNGEVATWNRGAEVLYGHRAAVIKGRGVTALFLESHHGTVDQRLRQVAGGTSVPRWETQGLRADGTTAEVSVGFSPVRDEDGAVVGVSLIARDIGERLAAQRRLEESEGKYQDLYHNAPDMYVTVDGNSWRIEQCNQTLLNTLNCDRDALLGRPLWSLCTPNSKSLALAARDQFQASGEVRDVEMQLQAPGGAVIDVSLAMSALRDSAGQIIAGRAVWRDITERKGVERRLREEIRQREHYLAMLSHELRNPLHGLQGAVAVLNQPEAKAQAVERAKALTERQVQHMARLLDDLLDVSRITQNKLELRRTHLDLREIVDETVEAFGSLFAEHGLRLAVENGGAPLAIDGDRDRLLQVQANLLNNAVRYAKGHGEVRLSLTREAGWAVLKVKDQGRGIAPDQLERIFELFYQVEAPIDRSLGGMGIGLTLVRLIVELHGGTVAAHSDGPGLGSEFAVRLPLVTPSTDGAGWAERPAIEAPERPLVAVVEDMEDSRLMLMELLELQGFEVCGAGDGHSGLALILQRRPQVALVDIGLPVLDGYQLAEEVRAQLGNHGPLLVAVSGYGQHGDLERSRAAGYDHHLVKPLNTQNLMMLLNQYTRRPSP
ncbi:MAG: CheR family methyltransferase [Candidatus Competibacterales bacterium]